VLERSVALAQFTQLQPTRPALLRPGAVLDVGGTQPVGQTRLGDPEILGDMLQRGLAAAGHGDNVVTELAWVEPGHGDIFPGEAEASQVRCQPNPGQTLECPADLDRRLLALDRYVELLEVTVGRPHVDQEVCFTKVSSAARADASPVRCESIQRRLCLRKSK
jgi:hypothetical protein